MSTSSIRKRLDSLKSLRLVNKKKKDGEDEIIEEHIIEKSSSNSEDEDKAIRDLNATSSPAKKRESTKCEIKYEIVNGEIPANRHWHSTCVVGASMIVFGGRNEFTVFSDLHMFDPGSMKWVQCNTTGSVPKPRYGHSAVVVGRKLYVFGGTKAGSADTNELYVLNTEKMKWRQSNFRGSAPCRTGHTATLLNKKMYIFGGTGSGYYYNDMHVYDIAKKIWSKLPFNGDVPHDRRGHSASLVDRRIVFFGGEKERNLFNDVYIFDTDANTMQRTQVLGTPPPPRAWHTAATVGGNKIVIAGGVLDDGMTDEDKIYVLDCEDLSWKTRRIRSTSGPTNVRSFSYFGHTASVFGTRIVLFGGKNSVTLESMPADRVYFITGIGDPAALGPDGHGSVDLQNNNVNPDPTDGPTSVGSSNGPMSTDKDFTIPEVQEEDMEHVGKADLVHQIRLLTQQLYHERENNKVVVAKYRNELQEEMNKVISMNKLIENMKKKTGSPRDNNINANTGPQSSIVVRTSPRSPPQSPERDGPASETTKRRPHKKSLPAIPTKKPKIERSSSLRPLEFWRDFEQKQAERKQDPKLRKSPRASSNNNSNSNTATSISSDTALEAHLAMLKNSTPREKLLIDWSHELAGLTEQKMALLKREGDLTEREAAVMQQELKLRDMADKQQLESAAIMRQIEDLKRQLREIDEDKQVLEKQQLELLERTNELTEKLSRDREELEQRIQQVVLKEEIMQQEQAKLQSEREMLEKLLEQRKREVKNVHNIKLIHAIQKEQIKKVKKCIEKGYDIKERDESGATSLHFAAKTGRMDIIELLIYSKGYFPPFVSIKDNNGWTALDHARQNKKPNQELIGLLEKLSREEVDNQKARESNMVRELYDQELVYRDLFNKITLNKKFSFPVERKHIMEAYFRYALFYNPVLKYTFLYKFLGEFDWETFKMDGMERVRLKKEEKKFVEIAKNYANNKIPQYEASRINPYKTIMIILDDDFPINDSMAQNILSVVPASVLADLLQWQGPLTPEVLKNELEKLRKKDHAQRKERAKDMLFRQMDRAQTELQHLKLIKDFYNETSKRSFNVQQFLEYEPQKLETLARDAIMVEKQKARDFFVSRIVNVALSGDQAAPITPTSAVSASPAQSPRGGPGSLTTGTLTYHVNVFNLKQKIRQMVEPLVSMFHEDDVLVTFAQLNYDTMTLTAHTNPQSALNDMNARLGLFDAFTLLGRYIHEHIRSFIMEQNNQICLKPQYAQLETLSRNVTASLSNNTNTDPASTTLYDQAIHTGIQLWVQTIQRSQQQQQLNNNTNYNNYSPREDRSLQKKDSMTSMTSNGGEDDDFSDSNSFYHESDDTASNRTTTIYLSGVDLHQMSQFNNSAPNTPKGDNSQNNTAKKTSRSSKDANSWKLSTQSIDQLDLPMDSSEEYGENVR